MRVFVLACAAAMFVCPAFSQAPPLPAICKCTATSGPTDVRECSKYDATGCDNTVFVKMDGGKCQAELRYCVICVRRLEKEEKRTVKWTLKVEDHVGSYVFGGPNKGIEINGSGVASKRDFENSVRLTGKQAFTWDAGPDVSNPLNHLPTVSPPGADDCKRGTPSPTIVNTDQ